MVQKKEVAIFGMGCFWEPDMYFSKLKGVSSTIVGYTGGEKKDPQYIDLGDHTEVVKITYDPNIITYSRLLQHFWKMHDPTRPTSRQYQSSIFTASDNQNKSAKLSLKREQSKRPSKILTEIRPVSDFYIAESYHQKYLEKNNRKNCSYVPNL